MTLSDENYIIKSSDKGGIKMQKEKIKNVTFNISGSNGITPRINLPKKWVDDMGINEYDREVILKYNEEKKKITIKKA